MSNTKGNRWAILIAIDFYMPGDWESVVRSKPGVLEDGVRSKPCNLYGCLNDVERVEKYLLKSGTEPHRIYKLTASKPNPYGDRQNEPKEESNWPTYDNIIRLLQEVTSKAEENDLIYFHYSGHGARAVTIFSDLKGNGGLLDEALVPTDIACGGRYLRDIEIACLLWDMTERNLVVTVVFDCCHSGGGVRHAHDDLAGVRGIREPDMNQLDGDKSVLSQAKLAAAYQRSVNDHGRAGQVPKRWFLESHGYLFFAACHADEYAKERRFDGRMQGIFTHRLMDALDSGSQLTYHKLYDIVSMKVLRDDPKQHVVLSGEGNRLFFDWGESQLLYAATVIEMALTSRSNRQATVLRLKAGRVHGIAEGAIFDVWPKYCIEFNESTRLARLSVTKVDAFTSEFKSMANVPSRQIEPGCLALPFPQKHLKFVPSTDTTSHESEEALRKALEACERYGHTVLQLDGPQNVKEDFRVLVKDGYFKVLDAEGKQLQHTIPPLRINSEGASEELGRRLTHIAKYDTIQDSKPKSSSLKDFSVEIGKMPDGWNTSPSPRHRETTGPPHATIQLNQLDKGSDNIFEVVDGSFVLFRMTNKANHAIHITVLNLESSWAITQVHPFSPGATHDTLDPNAGLDLPLKMSIPEAAHGEPEIVDKFIVFATEDPTSFRWLELPPLDGNEESDEVRIGRTCQWEPVEKWTTVEVVIRTKRW